MSFILRHRYAALIVAVLIPRLAWFALLGGTLPEPVRDQVVYISAAGRIITGEGLSFSREDGWLRHRMVTQESFRDTWAMDPDYIFGIIPVETPTAAIEPGYPLMLACVFFVTGPFTGGVFLLNCLFALAGAWAVWTLVCENWGERQGILAALLWSVYPYYVYYSAYAMTETVHFSLLPLIALLTFRACRGRWSALLAGVSTGFLFLVRSTALFLLPLQTVWLFAKRKWREALLAACGFILCCIPWVVRNQIQLGSPVLMPTKGALNLWMRNNPDLLELEGIEIPGFVRESISRRDLLEYPSMEGALTEVERSDLLMERARDFIMANPVLIAYLTVLRAGNFLSPAGATLDHPAVVLSGVLIYLPMLVLGIIEAVRRRRDGRILFLALTFLLYLALHSLAHGGVRYRLPVDMVLIVLASLFIGRRAGWEGPTGPVMVEDGDRVKE
ncbi:MAG: glycosyltransferase family 39 protein [Candidatus Fermentibacteraceae bacterium]|nr:glycosyltransferase family 39 protein [Candidatus Fermentibacteraceae bacterium]MBN2608669.1 glycosyltransferase family 39 protein [Candidatus Fermentibacteraceae bacterium]